MEAKEKKEELIREAASVQFKYLNDLINKHEQTIKKLEQDKAKLLGEISLKNINLIEVEKENTKLKQQIKELELKNSTFYGKLLSKLLDIRDGKMDLKSYIKKIDLKLINKNK